MKYLFLDCEYNGFRGKLISMALFDPVEDIWFYETIECKSPEPWVEENVIPVLNKRPISYTEFQYLLEKFLKSYHGNPITIVADWPEDIIHFCNSLITGPGRRLKYPREFYTLISGELDSSESEIPHNALEDAKAIYRKTMRTLNV